MAVPSPSHCSIPAQVCNLKLLPREVVGLDLLQQCHTRAGSCHAIIRFEIRVDRTPYRMEALERSKSALSCDNARCHVSTYYLIFLLLASARTRHIAIPPSRDASQVKFHYYLSLRQHASCTTVTAPTCYTPATAGLSITPAAVDSSSTRIARIMRIHEAQP